MSILVAGERKMDCVPNISQYDIYHRRMERSSDIPPDSDRGALDRWEVANCETKPKSPLFSVERCSAVGDLMGNGLAGDLRDNMIAGIALAHHGTLAARNAAHL
jgi:hypothetical protein